MRLRKGQYLPDVNVLIALTEEDHVHHRRVTAWFDAPGIEWGLCPFTEAGFLRVATNPKVGMHTIEEASEVLTALGKHAGYSFWPVPSGWADLTAPLKERVFGHQQITDAFLLGLAVKEDGILVTLDKAIQYLAGATYRRNVLVLEV